MKTKYIFLSALILVAVASVWASEPNEIEKLRSENTTLKELAENFRQKNIKLRIENENQAKTIANQHDENGQLETKNKILQNRFDMLYELCKNSNISMPVFKSDISKKFVKPLSVGQVSYLQEESFEMQKRVFADTIQEWNQTITPTVQEVIDANNMLVALNRPDPRSSNYVTIDTIVWISGINTSGLIDGSKFVSNKPFVIKGTRKNGSGNTVFVLEPAKVFPD